MEATPLLLANQLWKSYKKAGHLVEALRGVSMQIGHGECLGVVGESGSGKSTLARVLLALERPDRGEIYFQERAYHGWKGSQLRAMRQHIQIIFQDPTAALSSRLSVWRSVMEPLDNFPYVSPPFLREVRSSRRAAATRLFELVGLSPTLLDRYPHELSGGQRQRVAIARGIALNPALLICDEPTSSLDVTVQAQILQLLAELKREMGMSMLFITHEIAAVASIADRMMVMRGGEVVDEFDRRDIRASERHAYTKLLVSHVH